jgi:crotonobetainyl-CoA:carnitine CoA-transferase CaiB-like acyl-CoA transferase
VVDTAIYEAMFAMMESVVPEYDRLGAVRGPSGSTITGIVPSNTYPCADGRWVIIGGNAEAIYRRLMRTAGRPDLADDPDLSTNAGRVARQEEVDGAISAWTSTLDAAEVIRLLEEQKVPVGPIYNVEDMMNDPHYQARGLFETVDAGGQPLKVPAILPKLGTTPGRTEWAGPSLGAHNPEILGGVLGLSDEELADLAERGVI